MSQTEVKEFNNDELSPMSNLDYNYFVDEKFPFQTVIEASETGSEDKVQLRILTNEDGLEPKWVGTLRMDILECVVHLAHLGMAITFMKQKKRALNITLVNTVTQKKYDMYDAMRNHTVADAAGSMAIVATMLENFVPDWMKVEQ